MADFMEDRLDLRLRDVLPILQHGILTRTTYFGIQAFKSPMDAWVYQEIVFETRPDVIVEVGTANGGSTLYLAHLCDLLGHGRVIGIDVSHAHVAPRVREHPRITLLEDDACACYERVADAVGPDGRILLVEDSSHTYENTLAVLRAYSQLAKPGDYLIVEDSIGRHGLASGRLPGPYEAIETFVAENADFVVDRDREHFFITWNPKGYLRRRDESERGRIDGAPGSAPFDLRRLRLRERLRLFVPPILVHLAERWNNRRMISSGERET